MSLLVVGSVALDSVETPFDKVLAQYLFKRQKLA